MSDPDEVLRRSVAEHLAPRLDDHATFLACADPDPLTVTRSDLLYLWDEYGIEYLDFATLTNPLGHRYHLILAVLSDQLRYHLNTAPPGQHLHRWAVQYAKDLAKAFSLPDGKPRKTLFCESERVAVWQAVTLAGFHSGKRIAVVDTGWYDWLPDRDLLNTFDVDRLDPDRHGAVLLNPVDTAAAPVENAREWILTARDKGITVIVDESVTGFGRWGTLWGQERVGLVADVTVLGGAVGGGLPLGAVVAAPDFFDPDMTDLTEQAGHPMACAAGLNIMIGLGLRVFDHLNELIPALSNALSDVVSQFSDVLVSHHGVGMWRGLRFADRALAASFPRAARDHGLHLAPARGDTILLAPALISSPNEVTRGVDVIADTLLSWNDKGKF